MLCDWGVHKTICPAMGNSWFWFCSGFDHPQVRRGKYQLQHHCHRPGLFETSLFKQDGKVPRNRTCLPASVVAKTFLHSSLSLHGYRNEQHFAAGAETCQNHTFPLLTLGMESGPCHVQDPHPNLAPVCNRSAFAAERIGPLELLCTCSLWQGYRLRPSRSTKRQRGGGAPFRPLQHKLTVHFGLLPW